MRSFLIVVSLFFTLQIGLAQVKNKFSISFDNAEHHEAKITGTFTNLSEGTVSLVMGRTSTENYALHEFTRNIYDLKITDGKGKNVTITKPNLYQWDVTGHDGTIHIYYTLFADKGNAIYSQIDEIHALINNPSAFMYVPSLKERPVEISYVSRNDLNWKIATPMKSTGTNTYQAANLADFMDSSTLLSNHTIQEYKVGSGNREQTIKMALNHNGSDIEAKELFEKIKRVIDVQKDVFGDYPSFDDNAYHFLVSLMPQMSTGGMGHRNSAVITSSKSITESTINDIVENFAHQFLHSWNKQRIRPVSLESFDYSKLNLLDELWFVDGITEYYANLSLCRAGIITKDEYISDLTQKYNQVWNSSALRHGGPIEMSRKASFLENTEDTRFLNKENTVIPYITYGEVLGLALDLSLRAENDDLNLDEFMKLFWTKYGKTEIRYTTDNIFLTLREYAGASFADHFFSKYIKSNNVPDFKKILGKVALYLKSNETPSIGATIKFTKNGLARISKYVKLGTAAYVAGLEKEDLILSIGNKSFSDLNQFNEVIGKNKVGKKVLVKYKRHGKDKTTWLKIETNPDIVITKYSKPSEKALQKRAAWLGNQELPSESK